MTRVYFVRHAEPDHTWADDRTRPLTREGLEDTVSVKDFFKGVGLDKAYSSPYRRSIDTIRSTAEDHSMAITEDERFRERKAGPGSNVRELFMRRWQDLSFHEEGGESIGAVQERNIQALEDVLRRDEDSTVIIGSHGTALSSILNYYDGGYGFDDFLRILNFMPYIIRLDFQGTELLGTSEEFHVEKRYG